MRFDFEDGFDRHWHGGSAFRSYFWSQLSTAFQPGEKFFVDSARALRHEVSDPSLLREMQVFCQQEGHHTAQHLKFDKLNEAHGLDIATCRRRYAFWLDLGRRRYTARGMLGVTCALEHFTSGLADLFHDRPEMMAGADPRVVALWSWHAAEEAEHRGTCFDVYQAAGGGSLTRARTLVVSWTIIVGVSLVNTLDLLAREGRLFRGDTLRGLWDLFGWRGHLTALWPGFLRYLHPRFHPWDGSVPMDPAAIREWQARNERYITATGAPDGLVRAT